MDFTITFTDLTLLESNGEYDTAKQIMEMDSGVGLVRQTPVSEWFIASDLELTTDFGRSLFRCNFCHDGNIVITDYYPCLNDIYLPDLRCLHKWALESGWQRIEPKQSVIESWPDFWIMYWETDLVYSRFLDKHYSHLKQDAYSDEESIMDEDDSDIYNDE